MPRSIPAAASALFLAAVALATASPAAGAERWEAAAGGAAVILPAPAKASGILGASLFCRERQWALLLRTDRKVPDGTPARIAVGGERVSAIVVSGSQVPTVDVPKTLLDLLKEGSGMSIALGRGRDGLSARFSLAGSRPAIESAMPRCSPVDMAGFDAVALQPAGPATETALSLVEEELARFRESTTGAVPVLSAAQLDVEDGRKLLFASLCGSNRYYGETGCKLMGFAAEAGGKWLPVYDTEGMALFRDPRISHGGWPDLITLSAAGGTERLRWTWNGAAYGLAEDAATGGTPSAILDGLRTGATGE